ncbi:hypothetical protein OHAE_331 [Ochrobactrum soli]|uniref:Uncharacterized protein n=1 Tax=Ochrobactrum soli TaxID=2448455 RepID=A0A2P9HJY6_9HYPH|nr:hypothetical protein OHAE_331 [[Ochrobactrum] soli]
MLGSPLVDGPALWWRIPDLLTSASFLQKHFALSPERLHPRL